MITGTGLFFRLACSAPSNIIPSAGVAAARHVACKSTRRTWLHRPT
jgi:hypothetical protein